MGKDMTVTMLYDFYGDMLTEKQAEAIELYYNEDLSLAEIAEPLGISRQGVRDNIKRGEKQLVEFEQTLGLARRFSDISADFEKMEILIKDIKSRTLDKNITQDIAQLEQLSEKIKGKPHKNP